MENDRTWPVNIIVYHDGDLNEITIRVRGDYKIGNLMALIGQQIDGHHDWSDHAIWWPKKRRWLKIYLMTLDQVDICANTELEFRPMHQTLRIQFPNLNVQELKVDFSVNVLTAVSKLCQDMDINHPEEWSLARPLTKQQLKRNDHNLTASPLQRNPTLSNKINSNNNIYDTINNSNGSLLSHQSITTISSNGSSINDSNHSLNNNNNNLKQSYKLILPHPKTAVQKARLNSAWLNSSISLFEQDVCENDLLLLRIKYFTFYDLKTSELSRLDYIYQNLKLNILQEEISCTEDEMYTLAGIMLQVGYLSGENNKFSNIPNGNGIHNHRYNNNNNNNNHYHHYNHQQASQQKYLSCNGNGFHNNNGSLSTSSSRSSSNDVDEVDCALESLEKELQTSSLINESPKINGKSRIMTIPKLEDKLKISVQNINGTSTLSRIKSTIARDRTYDVVFQDTTLAAYQNSKNLEIKLNMNECEVNPDVMASQQRFCFQIIDSRKLLCYYVKCQNEDQYARWFAACKQASLGRTMAHPSYTEKYKETLNLLTIQSKFSRTKNIDKQALKNSDIDPSELIAPRFLKRKSREHILSRIKTANETFANDTLIDAQMKFIKICQTLRDYAISLFVVKFYKSKKEDLLGAMPDKLVLIDMNNGTLKKTWRYKTMINWNINWEVKRMTINFHNETLEFECISSDCKTIHEFIGGYIYMSMRGIQITKFDEEQFLKLTGGWNDDDLLNDDNDEDEHIAMCRREAWANLKPDLMVK